jgi:signal transduction histidine kinase
MTSGIRVLVIGGDLPARTPLFEALEAGGYAVLAATTGDEGLRMASTKRPAAMLLDGSPPDIDTGTLIRRVRLNPEIWNTPCLLLAGSPDRDAELRALTAGADHVIRREPQFESLLQRLAEAIQLAGERPDARAPVRQAARRVLVVDDDPAYLEMLACALRGDGYEVMLAPRGESAIELLATSDVDCIVLDRSMPGIGGEETCRRVKAAPGFRDVPLIMLTALEDRDAMVAGLRAGADDFISKSSDLEVVRARVGAQIRRKQIEDDHVRLREELLRAEIEAAASRAAQDLAATRAVLIEELERKNRELEAFSYSVSHDLRAPLRSISGFSEALLEDCAPILDPKHRDYLQRIHAASLRMSDLIDALLRLSRIGRAEINRSRVDLSLLARDIVALFRRRHPERHVDVEIAEGLNADADGRLMWVVLENLLGNAWKFTSGTTQPLVQFRSEASDQGPVFVVQDNGAGFDMTFAQKLFQPFQRLHRTVDFPGTGIGLATVQRIVDRHGGRVWAHGEPGRGASVFFTIPAYRPVELS